MPYDFSINRIIWGRRKDNKWATGYRPSQASWEREFLGRVTMAWGTAWEAVTPPIPSPNTLKSICTVQGTVPPSKATVTNHRGRLYKASVCGGPNNGPSGTSYAVTLETVNMLPHMAKGTWQIWSSERSWDEELIPDRPGGPNVTHKGPYKKEAGGSESEKRGADGCRGCSGCYGRWLWWKRPLEAREQVLLWNLQRGTQSCWHLHFSQVRPTSVFWPPEL